MSPRSCAWVLFALCLSGCVSAGGRRTAEQGEARARALVLEGCYDCLLEARATLRHNGGARNRQAALELLFQVELLLALREKELGLDSTESLAGARRLQARLPARLTADRFLMLVEAVPPDEAALPTQDYRTFLSQHRPVREHLSHWLAWLKTGSTSPVFRQYVFLALACGYPADAPARADEGKWAASADAPPLLQFRAALCGDTDPATRLELRQRPAGFPDLAFVLAKRELRLVQVGGSVRAIPYLDEAYRRFNRSAAVTYLSGVARQVTGDCRGAIPFFEQTTAIRPAHERALLATTICSSYLGQHTEAMEAASRLIDLAAPNAGEAYYWRAWNRHRRRELPEAVADIARAKTLVYNEMVLTLAGIIAYDREALDESEHDLSAARGVNAGNRNCTAAWYLGLVKFKREQWSTAARNFADATACYERQARDTEARLDALRRRTDLPAVFRDSQVAGLETALSEDRTQQSAAAYNAALNYARSGDLDNAATYAETAARDPARAASVEELRKMIKSPRR